jgi:hypothetical protein
MVAIAAGALSGRVFRLPRGIIPPVRSGRWRVVERRAFEEAGGIVGVRPCGRGEDKGEKASAGKHRPVLRAFHRSISARRSFRSRQRRHSALRPLVRAMRRVAIDRPSRQHPGEAQGGLRGLQTPSAHRAGRFRLSFFGFLLGLARNREEARPAGILNRKSVPITSARPANCRLSCADLPSLVCHPVPSLLPRHPHATCLECAQRLR